MTEATGTIISLDGDYAMVQLDETGCGRCHEPGGCGGQNISKMFCDTAQVFRVINPGKVATGTRVTIAIAEGAVRYSVALAYGVPLSSLLAGAFIGSHVADEPGAIGGAIGGLVLGWLLLRLVSRRHTNGRNFQPYICR